MTLFDTWPRFPWFFTSWAQLIHGVFFMILATTPHRQRQLILAWFLVFNLSISICVLIVFQLIFFHPSGPMAGFSPLFRLWMQVMHWIPALGLIFSAYMNHFFVEPIRFEEARVKACFWWAWHGLGGALPQLVYIALYDPREVYGVNVALGYWVLLSTASLGLCNGLFFALSYRQRKLLASFPENSLSRL
jgi:hypothetical protein